MTSVSATTHDREAGPGKHDRPELTCHTRAALLLEVLVPEGEGVDGAVHFVGEPLLAKRLLSSASEAPACPRKHQLEGGRGRRREVGPGDLGGGEGHDAAESRVRGKHSLELVVYLAL